MGTQKKHTRTSKLGKTFEAGDDKTIKLDFAKHTLEDLVEHVKDKGRVRAETNTMNLFEHVANKLSMKRENVLYNDIIEFLNNKFQGFIVTHKKSTDISKSTIEIWSEEEYKKEIYEYACLDLPIEMKFSGFKARLNRLSKNLKYQKQCLYTIYLIDELQFNKNELAPKLIMKNLLEIVRSK